MAFNYLLNSRGGPQSFDFVPTKVPERATFSAPCSAQCPWPAIGLNEEYTHYTGVVGMSLCQLQAHGQEVRLVGSKPTVRIPGTQG